MMSSKVCQKLPPCKFIDNCQRKRRVATPDGFCRPYQPAIVGKHETEVKQA